MDTAPSDGKRHDVQFASLNEEITQHKILVAFCKVLEL
jgi:hypothetical protein